ncbi:MAG: hypothetical protein JJU12_06300 [Chlamydiales bacterium]|nr:hypothetical protein [Chlamydiales bacterium]
MKRILQKCAMFLILTSAPSLSASDYFSSCDPCCNYNPCCGNFYGTVEGLYWRVNHDPIGIARRANGNVNEPVYLIDDTYHYGRYSGGVRARAGYEACAFFADIAYLYFSDTDKKSQNRDRFSFMTLAGETPFNNDPTFGDEDAVVIGPQINYDSVNSRARFRYQNVDLRFGYTFCPICCFEPFVYVDARWVKVDYRRTLYGEGFDGSTGESLLLNSSTRSRFSGGGLGLGLGGRYTLFGKFGIASSFNFIALIGETLFNYSASQPVLFENQGIIQDFNPNFERSKKWDHVFPGVEFRIGVDYAFCLCNFDFVVEVGYELDWYSNLLFYPSKNEPFAVGSAGIPTFTSQDIGFSGPFFRLTAAF